MLNFSPFISSHIDASSHNRRTVRIAFAVAAAALVILVCSSATTTLAQHNFDRPPWTDLSAVSIRRDEFMPQRYRTLNLDEPSIRSYLEMAPAEFTHTNLAKVVLQLPLPDGGFGRFLIYDSPIMSEELVKQFPEIRSYSGQGLDDVTATLRISISPKGLHAFVISSAGSFIVRPNEENGQRIYLAYFVKDSPRGSFDCFANDPNPFPDLSEIRPDPIGSAGNLTGQTLRSYRMTLSATTQFYQFSGNTDAGLMTNINILLNSVNAIYEREATIRFIFSWWLADRLGTYFPANQDLAVMKQLNQQAVDAQIGSANYDTGIALGFNPAGPSGLSEFSVFCSSGVKARVAAIMSPDLYQSTIVFAHEMGHAFNARHSMSSFFGSCASQNDLEGRFEPGSGSTIMSYAGICGPDNLQGFGDNVFHVNSLTRIINHVDVVFPACGTRTSTGNSPPVIDGATGVGAFIPASTPFALTGFATDANSDPLVYSWEQIDSGTGLSIFRPYLPSTSPTRTFPSLPFILSNANVPPTFNVNGYLVGETLPNSTRTMNFALTVRDNRSAAGGTTYGSLQLNVRGDAGPFVVTQPNTSVSWTGNSQQTVTWNVANTNTGLINTANVRILLSTDGGQTFPVSLADSTPNDGSQTVTIPNTPTTTARIKVEAVGNIYFDISNTNFTITAGPTSARAPYDFDGDRKSDVGIFRPSNGQWWINRSSNGSTYAAQFGTSTDRIAPGDYTGDGKMDLAFWRPANGQWFILRSEDSSFYSFPFGLNGDVPTAGDYDGDGKTDAAVFRPSNSTWYIRRSSDGGTTIQQFGTASDLPVPSDYDGDGRTDIAIFRPSAGQWWMNRSTAGVLAVTFGNSTDKLVPGDYTGDGKSDNALWRPSTGEWFILRSENFSFYSFPFGTNGDLPAPGDYDGDAKFDATVFRPTNATWYSQRSTAGTLIQQFGANGDRPIANAFVP